MIWKAIALLALGVSVLGDDHHHYAYSEQNVQLHNVQRGHHGELGHIGHHPEHHQEYAHAYPSYEFSYKVSDPHTHDFKGQHETRDGDVVKGEYWLVQPDGVKRTVKYHADKHSGFKAQVHYDGPHKHIVEHHPRHIEHHKKSENREGEKENESSENEKREREMIERMMKIERENRERENKYHESEGERRMKEHHKHQIIKHKPVISHVASLYKERESESEGEYHESMGKIPVFDFERIQPKVEHKEHHMEHKEDHHKKYSGYQRKIYHPYWVKKEMESEIARNEERAEPEKRMEEENVEGRGGYNKHYEPYYGHKRHYYQH